MHVGIVGATGTVGKVLIQLLEKKQFPLQKLSLFASPRSQGKTLPFKNHSLPVQPLTLENLKGIDLLFFAAGKKVSEAYIPEALKQKIQVIDLSSAYRENLEVPLIIPEINGSLLQNHFPLIASPNCSTTIMLMVLAPLYKIFGIERIVASTYQAASGAGEIAMQELLEESRHFLENKPFKRSVMPHPYAFNLFPHNATMTENFYNEEELKIVSETRKILKDPLLPITATCVRVPVLRAHSEALNITFTQTVSREEIYHALSQAPGIALLENWEENRFAMPSDASGEEKIFYGRIRKDPSYPNTFWFWVVGDQLLKGAALNALQIAECLYSYQKAPHE